ncbi:hypothetical protein FRC12_006889 [Ceratobasidium sp. 428]|nr:hypothetical protein FRC12_006889 [Ceratobasidium sp. 428]
MARITYPVVQYQAQAPAGHPNETTPVVQVHELPQHPVQDVALIGDIIPHIPILPDAVDMGEWLHLSRLTKGPNGGLDPVEPVAPNGGLLLLPQAPAHLLGSFLGLQGLQDAEEIQPF